MAENAVSEQTPAPAEEAVVTGDALEQLIDQVTEEQHALKAENEQQSVRDAIRQSEERHGDLKATITERNPETGKVETYDALLNPVSEGEHPAAGPPKDPETAPAEEPAADAATAPDPKASHSAEEFEVAKVNAELSRLHALQEQARTAPVDVKPDLSDEPNWDDENKYPTMEAAQKARREWYAERYDAAVKAAIRERTETLDAQIARQDRAAEQLEGQRIHREVQGRLKLDDAGYREAVTKYAAVTHPQYNEKFTVRNPVGSALLNAAGKHAAGMRAAGVDAKGYDGPAGLHEAQVGDPKFAQAVASLPITQETSNLIDAVASHPRAVAVLRHLVGDAGKADLQRVLRPGVPAAVVSGELYRIAGGLKGGAAEKAAPAAAAPAAAGPAPRAAKPAVPVIPTPGRSQPAAAAGAESVETHEGMQARFDRLLKEGDRNGTNGWGYL